ncbi:MAG: hypothetical protein KKF20_06795 [Bacteroidetes bacterium]|nr:hypothetical protein [Bacteroidota bacterium]MBU1423636.1 hypothetical protein [Bacteroidota bacterium]MBU2472099.1 hypothetical protein [Bacteroidota bacterium]
MNIRLIFVVFLSSAVPSFASFEGYETGSRAKSLGNAFVGLADDCWAIYYNPAGLARINQNNFSFFYLPNQFGLSELTTAAIAGSYSTQFGTFGVGVRKFGFELYKELSVTVSYANNVAGIYFGANLNYNHLAIRGYGSDAAIGLDAGVLLPLIKNLYLGVAAKNVNIPTIGKSKEKLPQVFSTGISYTPVNNLILLVDYQKELGFDASPKFGAEYKIFDMLSLRFGVSDNPTSFASGVGIEIAFVHFDYALFTHQELGISHSATITFRWGN